MERVREASFANVRDSFPCLMRDTLPIQDVTAGTDAARRHITKWESWKIEGRLAGHRADI